MPLGEDEARTAWRDVARMTGIFIAAALYCIWAGGIACALAVGIRHELVTTAELEREGYRQNDRDRCYHCKTELYDRLSALAERRGYATVLSGATIARGAQGTPTARAS